MNKETTFHYTYSASQNREVQAIREKYITKEESKLEKLQRLDRSVKLKAGITSMCFGIIGCLLFGIGMCMGLGVFGAFSALCLIPGMIGALMMIIAYPVYSLVEKKKKTEVAPTILRLSEELMNEVKN